MEFVDEAMTNALLAIEHMNEYVVEVVDGIHGKRVTAIRFNADGRGAFRISSIPEGMSIVFLDREYNELEDVAVRKILGSYIYMGTDVRSPDYYGMVLQYDIGRYCRPVPARVNDDGAMVMRFADYVERYPASGSLTKSAR